MAKDDHKTWVSEVKIGRRWAGQPNTNKGFKVDALRTRTVIPHWQYRVRKYIAKDKVLEAYEEGGIEAVKKL